MSTYTFLPWVRQGLSRRIAETDTLGASDGSAVERASVHVALTLGYYPVGSDTLASDGLKVESDARVLGPGDSIGVRPRAIVESVPAPGSVKFPATHLAYITFYDEDFPWRFTPAAPSGLKLRPWLALLVLKAEEHELTPRAERLPILTVKAAYARAVLPPPEELWAWAHAQVSAPVGGDSDLDAIAGATPNLTLSRIIAPRRLEAATKYFAYLVPSFETGRVAGLDEKPEGVKAQKPAWPVLSDYAAGGAANPPRDVRLPVYHAWSFETRDLGDFETLVAALVPRVAGAEFGFRPMDISEPGYGLDGIVAGRTLSLEGALIPPLQVPDPFPDPARATDQDYVDRLESVLDLSANLARQGGSAALPTLHPFAGDGADGTFSSLADDPILTPPTYGQWHALVERLAATPADRQWLREINLDPRQRVAAGIGAEIVRSRDDELTERAWDQIGEVLAANQRLREAELATHVAEKMHVKHVQPLDDDRLVQFTRSAHASVVATTSGQTVSGVVAASPIPAAALSAAFRRAARPQRKGLRRAFAGDGTLAALQDGLVSGLNDGSLTGAPALAAAAATVTVADVEQAVTLALQKIVQQTATPAYEFLQLLWSDLSTRGGNLPSGNDWIRDLLGRATTPDLTTLINAITSVSATATQAVVEVGATVFNRYFEDAVRGKYYAGLVVQSDGGSGRLSRAVLASDVQTYRDGVTAFQANVLANLPIEVQPPPLTGLSAVSVALRSDLSPATALPRRLEHIVVVSDPSALASRSPAQVLAYPRYPEPQFEYLKRLSYDFIIPNVQGLPLDTITLLETNQRFVEAFLAGMNHELGRELLWREFPTDQRGTYFERFWDMGDSQVAAPPPDIETMDTWRGALGNHAGHAGATLLVLTIRSELFQQYPRTVVYAHRAVWQSDQSGERHDLTRRLKDAPGADDQKFPVFHAELEPDIQIFAFDLDAGAARGGSSDAGWFFVLKERPGQSRFGADDGAVVPLEDWNDLTYAHLTFPPETPELLRVDGNLGAGLVPTSTDTTRPIAARWGRSGADMAFALLQAPVLYARHAAELLPTP